MMLSKGQVVLLLTLGPIWIWWFIVSARLFIREYVKREEMPASETTPLFLFFIVHGTVGLCFLTIYIMETWNEEMMFL